MLGIPSWILEVSTVERLPLAASLCLPRLIALMSILPFFSGQILTGTLKQAVAASLLLLVIPPTALSFELSAMSLPVILLLIVKEVIIGILLGFPFAVLFWAFEGAGFFIDNQRGSSMASSMDPLSGSQTTVLGSLFSQAFTVYFFVSGAFLGLLTVIYTSYKVWPVVAFFPNITGDVGMFYLNMMDGLMAAILALSGPVIVAMFLSEFGLALISRFAPQLNVFFLAMPIKSGVGMFVLIVYLPIMFSLAFDEKTNLDGVWERVRGLLQ